MAELVIEAQNLSKRYGDFVAVDQVNLTLHAGEVFGVLGPNGSGKTTTILMLLGLTEPTAGSARVLGYDPQRQPLQVKSRVGYLPDQVGFDDELTARENLSYMAKLNGLRHPQVRITEALARMGLQEVAPKRVKTFSRGMKQRLGVAEILLKRPRVVILDEPTLGLDPEAAREFLQIIRDLKREGITVLLASHLLHQVQMICDRVGLFYRGRIVLEGRVSELAQRVLGGAYRVHLRAEGPDVAEALKVVAGVVGVQQRENGLYDLETRGDVRAEIVHAVIHAGARLLAIGLQEPSLDEIYSRYFEQAASERLRVGGA